MKDIWRIIKFTGELWRYYVAVSLFTILLAGMSQLQPLFTKGAVDQVAKLLQGGHADVKLVAIFAAAIFLTDFGQTIFSNIAGFIGDVLFVIDGFLITPPALTGPRRQIDKYGVQREQHQADLPRIMEYDEQRKDRTENELQKGIT